MGELLLCSHGLASVPYYVESIALNVYSLEELCYFLKENIDLIEPSFMDRELAGWVETELHMPDLAQNLYEKIRGGARLSEFIEVLVSGCSYCSREELEKMQQALTDFENKSETECRKIRADRLLLKKRYDAAISEYTRLLNSAEVRGILSGNVYHNLGTAYAGLFFFEEAAASSAKAFERNQNPLSKQQQKIALQLAKGAIPRSKAKEAETDMTPELLERWKEAYLKSCR